MAAAQAQRCTKRRLRSTRGERDALLLAGGQTAEQRVQQQLHRGVDEARVAQVGETRGQKRHSVAVVAGVVVVVAKLVKQEKRRQTALVCGLRTRRVMQTVAVPQVTARCARTVRRRSAASSSIVVAWRACCATSLNREARCFCVGAGIPADTAEIRPAQRSGESLQNCPITFVSMRRGSAHERDPRRAGRRARRSRDRRTRFDVAVVAARTNHSRK